MELRLSCRRLKYFLHIPQQHNCYAMCKICNEQFIKLFMRTQNFHWNYMVISKLLIKWVTWFNMLREVLQNAHQWIPFPLTIILRSMGRPQSTVRETAKSNTHGLVNKGKSQKISNGLNIPTVLFWKFLFQYKSIPLGCNIPSVTIHPLAQSDSFCIWA